MKNEQLIELMKRLVENIQANDPLKEEAKLAISLLEQRERSIANWALELLDQPFKQLLDLLHKTRHVEVEYLSKISGNFYRLTADDISIHGTNIGELISRALEEHDVVEEE